MPDTTFSAVAGEAKVVVGRLSIFNCYLESSLVPQVLLVLFHGYYLLRIACDQKPVQNTLYVIPY